MIDFPATPTTGQIFTVGGASWRYNGASWAAYTGSLVGDITSVVAGTGLTGGGTSGDVTLNLANTAVTAGSYTYATLTVDAQGRLTAASSGAPSALGFVGDTAPASPAAGQFWWNSSPGDGQLYLYYNDGTSSQWVVANNPGSGIYLPLVGGQLNPGGLLIGAAGTVPGQGALTLNANTVAPPAGLSGNLFVVGADGTRPTIALDGYGTGGSTHMQTRTARGTAGGPTATQQSDVLYDMVCLGYGTAYANGAAITVGANETWTGTSHGTFLAFQTNPNGAAAFANSLILAGNSATFSGNIVSSSASSSLTLGSASLATDGTGYYFTLPTGNGAYYFRNAAASTVLGQLDPSGNFTISGAVGTKASGTTWANPSSRDIKENIQPYDKGLQAVLALKPVTYKFRKDSGLPTEGTHIGLVHDETAHMPEMHRTLSLGSGDEAREVDGLDCSAVTWALVNALKEIDQRLKAGGL